MQEGVREAVVSLAGQIGVPDVATAEGARELAEAVRARHFSVPVVVVDLRPLFTDLIQRGCELALEPYGHDIVREGHEARAKRAVGASALDEPVPFDDTQGEGVYAFSYVVRDDNPLRVGLLDALAAVMPESVRVLRCGPCCQRSIERVLKRLPHLQELTLGTCYNFFDTLSVPPHAGLTRLSWSLGFFDSLTPDYDPELVAATVEAVVRACPSLTAVELDSWLGFAFAELLLRIVTPQLRVLRSRLELVEDDMPMRFSRKQWQELLAKARGLEDLELRGLAGLLDARDAHLLGSNLTRLVLIAPYGERHDEDDEDEEDEENEEGDEADVESAASVVKGCPRLSELAIMGGTAELADALSVPLVARAHVLTSLS